ncbi:hypothetical protein JCM11251_004673 [Rhodosporidiobolus azoricus]
MSNRYVQDKATTQRHLAILKEMLKRPENKLCADCKRNDPRWASTNLGCFMCIRCSGIHRGMGVHITRIRSVDLDTWTPEQIEFIQRWGNKRANAYWEAHLKQGHAPPDHKIESFIRSKYELKRWAMEGPVPEPETLDGGEAAPSATAPAASSAPAPTRKSAATTSLDLLSAPPSSSSARTSSSRTANGGRPPAPVPPKAQPKPEASLFDLDFGSPAPPVPAVSSSTTAGAPPALASPAAAPAATPAPVKRDPKADILSLFAAAPPPRPQPVQQQQQASHRSQASVSGVTGGLAGLSFGGGPAAASGGAADPWSQPQQASQPQMGGGGGGFGAFDGFQSGPVGQQSTPSHDPWASSAPPAASSSIWGSSSTAPTSQQPQTTSAFSPPAQPSKPDPFGDFGAFTSSGGGAGGGATDIWGSSSGGGANNNNPGGGASGGFSDIWA